ncbi:15151_t:CDS:2 [Acaulospora morrowiae]|uniref:15151_t:CDS:1 n=1 Tax=Acaulospora morrowiae TaxID=94023 RepID=A0A9N8V7S5_9GLOM|nr:15151_t:CDS:2 [Acaulospora morrowiae]
MVNVDSESQHFFKNVAPRKDGTNWKGRVQNLKELCLDVLMKNRRQYLSKYNNLSFVLLELRKVGKAPYWLMKPIYDKLEPSELEELEKQNPGLKEDTMELWKKHCIVRFPDEYNLPDQDWRKLFFEQRSEEARRLGRACERLRKSTQENKKRRKVKLISPLNLPPMKRNHGGWVKLTPLQRELKKTLRSGAYEHRTHFTQLESGPTMMTVPVDWLQGSRATSESSYRVPAQVTLPSKYLPVTMNTCNEQRRVDPKLSLVNNREVDRNHQLRTANRSTASSPHLIRRSSTATPPSNILPTSVSMAYASSSSKRPHEIESATPVAKRSRVESSTNVYSRIQTVSKQPGVVAPEKLKNSKLNATSSRSSIPFSKKLSISGDDSKCTSTGSSRRMEHTTTLKSRSTIKVVKSPVTISSSSIKLTNTTATTTNNARKISSIKKEVRHEPYHTKKQRIVRNN